jgi:hypothetical protein
VNISVEHHERQPPMTFQPILQIDSMNAALKLRTGLSNS